MAGTVLKLHGVKEAMHALGEMPRRLRFRHLRIALNAGGGVLKRAAEGYAPRETGMLKQSLGVKVKIPDASFNKAHHGKAAYVVIGPRRHFVRAFVRKDGKSKTLTDKKALKTVLGGGSVMVRNPARYAHLVHGGTIRAKSNPFLSRAVATAGGAAQQTVARKMQTAIAMEAYALARK